MNKRLCFFILVGFWLNCFQAVNASIVDENGPNPMVVGRAFGFMLFGNDGFMTPGIENLAVDGCKVSYETDGGFYSHAIQRIYVSYDLNKANWRSAVYQPDYYNDIVNMIMNLKHTWDGEVRVCSVVFICVRPMCHFCFI